MKYKTLPQGEKIPVIGLGTWEVGGHMSPDTSQDEEIVRAWREALDMGYRHIDTAEMYGGGHTEELVGRVIEGFPREDLFLASKVWHSHLDYEGVMNALEGSLQRLGTDYLDMYMIHWPGDAPLEETFRAFNDLVEQGKVRHLGVSNFGLDMLKRARELSATPLATNQAPYSVSNRKYEENGVLAYCQEEEVILTAYTPIEKGRVSQNGTLQEIARGHDATPVQVALSWLIQQPSVITIPQSTNPDHLRENLEAVELELSDEEMQRITDLEV